MGPASAAGGPLGGNEAHAHVVEGLAIEASDQFVVAFWQAGADRRIEVEGEDLLDAGGGGQGAGGQHRTAVEGDRSLARDTLGAARRDEQAQALTGGEDAAAAFGVDTQERSAGIGAAHHYRHTVKKAHGLAVVDRAIDVEQPSLVIGHHRDQQVPAGAQILSLIHI